MDQRTVPIGPIGPNGPVSPAFVYNGTITYASATSPAVTDTTFNASPVTSPLQREDGLTAEPPKKRQKRNKPTLSCVECVERKTKVSCTLQCLSRLLNFNDRHDRPNSKQSCFSALLTIYTALYAVVYLGQS